MEKNLELANQEKPDHTGENVLPFHRKALDFQEPPGDNWLWKLPIGTHFLSQPLPIKSPFLNEFIIRSKSTHSVLLEAPGYAVQFVDPVVFSDRNKLFEIIQILE